MPLSLTRKLLLGMSVALAVLPQPVLHAAQPTPPITVYANGYQVPFTQSPFMDDGYMLVQLRPLFETLGLKIDYEENTRTIICTVRGSEIRLTIDSTEALVNGSATTMPVAPRIVDGSAFIPLRFTTEKMAATVDWDETRQRADVITDGGYPVYLAVMQQDTKKVQELLEDFGSANFANRNDGLSSLSIAVTNGNLELVKLLLSYSADPNRSMAGFSRQGISPLEYAVINGNPELVRLLLDYGADPGPAAGEGSVMELAAGYRTKAADPSAQERAQTIMEMVTAAVKHHTERLQGETLLVPFNVGGAANAFTGKSGHWGYFDSKGQLAVSPKFGLAYPFSEGLAFAFNKDLTQGGYIDQTGQYKITFDFTPSYFYGDFHEGLALIGKDSKWGFIDTTGQFVIPPEYDWAAPFSEDGLARVLKDELWGAINRQGVMVVEPIYKQMTSFTNGLAWVEGRQNGFINTKGELVVDADKLGITPVDDFNGPLAPVRFDGNRLIGFIDRTGNTVIKPVYNKASGFHEGLAAVRLEDKYGYIDSNGKLAIPLEFDNGFPFRNGKAIVKLDDVYYFIDKNGARIDSEEYDSVDSIAAGTSWDQHTPFTSYANGMLVLRQGERTFYLLPDGKLLEWTYPQ